MKNPNEQDDVSITFKEKKGIHTAENEEITNDLTSGTDSFKITKGNANGINSENAKIYREYFILLEEIHLKL